MEHVDSRIEKILIDFAVVKNIDIQPLLDFLSRRFSFDGQKEIAKVTLLALSKGKTMNQVMEVLTRYWDSHWYHQEPFVRAWQAKSADSNNPLIFKEIYVKLFGEVYANALAG